MNVIRMATCGVICTLVFALSLGHDQPAKAQVYYAISPDYSPPPVPLPHPGFVVYSPTYLAFRSSGYYGGNWGPFYYQPMAMYPYISGTTIWPTVVPTYHHPVYWTYP